MVFKLMCLLEKLELVKDIIVALAKHLESGSRMEEWVGLNLDRFLSRGKIALNPKTGKRTRYNSLFLQRDFDTMYVLSARSPFQVQELITTHQKPKRRR